MRKILSSLSGRRSWFDDFYSGPDYIHDKKRRQVVQLAFRDELTGGDNFTAWKKKFEEQITDGNRAHYAVLFLDAGLDTISHIYGYPESEMALQIISDICVSMLADGSEAMSRFNQFYLYFFSSIPVWTA